jgi:hypothetical protein
MDGRPIWGSFGLAAGQLSRFKALGVPAPSAKAWAHSPVVTTQKMTCLKSFTFYPRTDNCRWRRFKLLSDFEGFSEQDRAFLLRFLTDESELREQRRIQQLLGMSGIKRVKRFSDFDWAFNPKIPRDKLMEFVETQWLKAPWNLVLIGPAGVGKNHI